MKIYEATIPAIEDPAQTAARIFEPQLQQKWPGNPAQSPPGGTQALNACLMPCEEPEVSQKPNALRLGAPRRLKTKQDFEQTRARGDRAVLGCLIANWRALESDSRSRLGVVASSKIGNAVVRNRAKRLMREAFRLHQNDLAGPLDLVLVARQSITGKSLAEVENTFLTILRKAGLLK